MRKAKNAERSSTAPRFSKIHSTDAKTLGGRAWIPSQAKFLNDFNKSFFHIRQMCHRFVLQLAHGVKRQAEAEIISARYQK